MSETRIIPPAGGRGSGTREIDPDLYPEQPRPRQVPAIAGARYGLLTVKWFAGLDIHGKSLFVCQCSGCGRWILVAQRNLVQRNTRSCGVCQPKLTRDNPKPKPKVQLDPYRASLVKGLSAILKKAEGAAEA